MGSERNPGKEVLGDQSQRSEQTRQKSIHERLEEKKRGMEQQRKKSGKEIKTGIACKETAGTVNVIH